METVFGERSGLLHHVPELLVYSGDGKPDNIIVIPGDSGNMDTETALDTVGSGLVHRFSGCNISGYLLR